MTTEPTQEQAPVEATESPDLQQISDEALGDALTVEEMMGMEKPEPSEPKEEKADEKPAEELEVSKSEEEASEESEEEKEVEEEAKPEVEGEDPAALFVDDNQYKIGDNVYTGAELKKELGQIDKIRTRFGELGDINAKAIKKEQELAKKEVEIEQYKSSVDQQAQTMKDLFGGLDPSDPFTSLATLMVNVNPKDGLRQLKELKAGLRKEVLKEIGATEEDIASLGETKDESFWLNLEKKQLEDAKKASDAKLTQAEYTAKLTQQLSSKGLSMDDFKSTISAIQQLKKRVDAGQAQSVEEINELRMLESVPQEKQVEMVINACIGNRISANAESTVIELVENTDSQIDVYTKLLAYAHEKFGQGQELTKQEMRDYINTTLMAEPKEATPDVKKSEKSDSEEYTQVEVEPEVEKETDALSVEELMYL